jgi:hypothetical protein|tara:strand:- start:132 stop:461 length:330 start_codon:yes stop_codon:yes gene_type:complete
LSYFRVAGGYITKQVIDGVATLAKTEKEVTVMTIALKTKKGFWGKAGAGGSYRGFTYYRAAPNTNTKKYANVRPQQKKIAALGRKIGEECKGQTGTAFKACRAKIQGTG